MAKSTLRTANVTALVGAGLLTCLVVVMCWLRVASAATKNIDLRWWMLPAVEAYTLIGGIVWCIGCIFSWRARRAGGREARRALWLNQAYVLFWIALFAWPTIDQTMGGGRAIREVEAARSEEERFYALGEAVKASFNRGNLDKAQSYASELLKLTPKFQRNWNYGNAIQDSNLVLGRIAIREGRVDDAKLYLLASGDTPGSPQLNSFGPNMSLAKDLLEKGERDVVLEYFERCRKFWDMNERKLDEWAHSVHSGAIPDFGANLDY